MHWSACVEGVKGYFRDPAMVSYFCGWDMVMEQPVVNRDWPFCFHWELGKASFFTCIKLGKQFFQRELGNDVL